MIRPHRIPNGPQNESYRWIEQALKVQSEYCGSAKLIHVMDREADAYELFDALVGQQAHFVIRICRDRIIDSSTYESLFEQLNKARVIFEREIDVSRRARSPFPKDKYLHPTRPARHARLSVAGTTAVIKKSKELRATLHDNLQLNFVHIWEENPPPGQQAIDWKLVTTQPIETSQQLEAIIDYYTARWVIEEYFKAIKTGCNFEARQQESLHALLTILVVFIPIAWWLLAGRKLAVNKTESSSLYFSEIQRRLLRTYYPKLPTDLSTISGVISTIARLGGHLKHNGPPGWQVLFRGYQKLLYMEIGYRLKEMSRCDM
ncbi:MAG: IS4 family transposase [Deltaproteobacteria bacterium]|nr:IS4 family transposase [Deltaproteobacteria bacterium]